jgi:anti-sigma B factor antagonist
MEFSIDQQDETKVIRATGKIMGEPDEASLVEAVQGLIDEGHTNVVMDLSKVTWMNSRGIGMCISALVSLRNKGGDFRLAGACHVVASLMEKCRISQVFQCFDSVDEAVSSFS